MSKWGMTIADEAGCRSQERSVVGKISLRWEMQRMARDARVRRALATVLQKA